MTLQVALPWQLVVQPPFGHVTLQVLLPVQLTVEPVSTSTSHLLPPSHETVLFVPVEIVHSLVPAQLEVQFDSHVPTQVDCPSQVVVQPTPHDALHVFFDWQSYETLFGGGAPLSGAPSGAVPPPNVHVPPVLQVHVAPLHVQSPVQAAAAGGSLPPQAVKRAMPSEIAVKLPTTNDVFEIEEDMCASPPMWVQDQERSFDRRCRADATSRQRSACEAVRGGACGAAAWTTLNAT